MEIGEVYDGQLVQNAKLLFQLAHDGLKKESNVENIRFGNIDAAPSHPYEKKLAFRIWKDGKIVSESPNAGVFGHSPSPPGFSVEDDDGDGHYWRNFVYVDQKEDIRVEVAEDELVRTELIRQILSSLLLPAILFVPAILLCIWWGVTRGLQPLHALSSQINERGSHDLTPLRISRMPEEVAPFLGALNRLFSGVEAALRHEREFTDNAAHELRTPLAAMKTQIQVLLRKGDSEADKTEGLDNLHVSVNRAVHMIEQLLSFSRLQNSDFAMTTVDLSRLCEEIIAEFAKSREGLAILKNDITPGIRISGNMEALSILMRNLLDNAFKHGPENSPVETILSRDGTGVFLEIRDLGPGIPEELQGRVFERFFRIDKSVIAGSGLGLSMVRWIADVHRSSVTIANLEPRGLAVKVRFPQKEQEAHRWDPPHVSYDPLL